MCDVDLLSLLMSFVRLMNGGRSLEWPSLLYFLILKDRLRVFIERKIKCEVVLSSLPCPVCHEGRKVVAIHHLL